MARFAAARAKAKIEGPCQFGPLLEIHAHILSNVCHEFRSALTAVQGYTKRVLEERSGPINDVQRADLVVVQKNTRRLLEMASRCLPFIAEQRLRVERLDLRDIWRHAARRMRPHLLERAVTLREDLPAAPLIVSADRPRMETAFEIILANAMECLPGGGEIVAGLTPGLHGEIAAKVLARGVALPARVLESVFEHGDESAPGGASPGRPRFRGLALAHDLIWLHGGRLAVKSNVGEGTVFVATLPAPAAEPGAN